MGSEGEWATFPVDGTEMELAAADIAAVFGAEISGFDVRVEAVGDGPASLRTTAAHVFPF
jgi:hypothetical protein